MRSLLLPVLAAVVISLSPFSSLTSHAGADKGEATRISDSETVIANSGYAFGILGGYGVEVGDPPELDIAQVMPFVSFPISGVVGEGYYRGVLEYKVEGVIGYVDNFNSRGQLGLNPIGLRYNFTVSGTMLVPFVELALGFMYLNLPKEVQGTRFNFTEGFGIGARIFVSDRTALEVSGRFRHLSNAGIKDPNPGINTVIVMVGISYF